jgi:tetratricopeptide (TPR) repeat protein
LYTLLAAETAGLRGDLPFALRNYVEQARITGDPGVIARAVQIAQYAGDEAALGELGLLWVDREPDNIQARELALFILLRQGKAQDALVHARFLLENGDGQPLRQLAAQAAGLPADQHAALLTDYRALAHSHPDDVDLLFGQSLLLWQAGQLQEALARSAHLIKLQPHEPASQLLPTQLLDETGRMEMALGPLEQAVRERSPAADGKLNERAVPGGLDRKREVGRVCRGELTPRDGAEEQLADSGVDPAGVLHRVLP